MDKTTSVKFGSGMQNKLPCKQTPGASCLWVLPSFLFLECLSTLKRVITCVFSDWHFGSVNYKLRCKKHNILVFKSIIWHVFVILLFIFWRGLAWEFWINRSFLNSSSILWDCYKVSLLARPCDSPGLTNGRRHDENNTGPNPSLRASLFCRRMELSWVCTHTHTCINTHTRVCRDLYTWMHKHTHPHVHMLTHIHEHTHVHTHTWISNITRELEGMEVMFCWFILMTLLTSMQETNGCIAERGTSSRA